MRLILMIFLMLVPVQAGAATQLFSGDSAHGPANVSISFVSGEIVDFYFSYAGAAPANIEFVEGGNVQYFYTEVGTNAFLGGDVIFTGTLAWMRDTGSGFYARMIVPTYDYVTSYRQRLARFQMFGGAEARLDLAFAGDTQWDVRVNRFAAIPEPATWAMMIAGFGMAGAAIRRRRAAIAC